MSGPIMDTGSTIGPLLEFYKAFNIARNTKEIIFVFGQKKDDEYAPSLKK